MAYSTSFNKKMESCGGKLSSDILSRLFPCIFRKREDPNGRNKKMSKKRHRHVEVTSNEQRVGMEELLQSDIRHKGTQTAETSTQAGFITSDTATQTDSSLQEKCSSKGEIEIFKTIIEKLRADLGKQRGENKELKDEIEKLKSSAPSSTNSHDRKSKNCEPSLEEDYNARAALRAKLQKVGGGNS